MSEQIKSAFLGNFGEYLIAWYFRSKFGIETAIVKGKGIDLLCKDKEGRLFSKDQLVAVSVKTRARSEAGIKDNVTVNWTKIKEASENWSAFPYFAYVRFCTEKGLITLFLVKVSDAEIRGKHYSVVKAEEEGDIEFEMRFEPYQFLPDW
jgi:hypothetical protein